MTDSKKNIPIASILIPVFNEEKYISDCLNSIIKNEKSRYDFEILIIDGGSTDKTLEIIKEYTLLYPYIK
jgi:glycosyltransferase involved in cell wall biosynthesis